jgi:hypothetical protein
MANRVKMYARSIPTICKIFMKKHSHVHLEQRINLPAPSQHHPCKRYGVNLSVGAEEDGYCDLA